MKKEHTILTVALLIILTAFSINLGNIKIKNRVKEQPRIELVDESYNQLVRLQKEGVIDLALRQIYRKEKGLQGCYIVDSEFNKWKEENKENIIINEYE